MWVRRWLQRRENRRGSVDLWLLRDEALVLDSVFTRHRDENKPLEAVDEAEGSALIALGAAIEGAVLDDVLSDDYTESLAEARERLLRRERN
jgi:helix-turn-helix protein